MTQSTDFSKWPANLSNEDCRIKIDQNKMKYDRRSLDQRLMTDPRNSAENIMIKLFLFFQIRHIAFQGSRLSGPLLDYRFNDLKIITTIDTICQQKIITN